MKKLVAGIALAIVSIFAWLSATFVDGTSSTKYLSTVQIFRRGMDDYVRGFARLGNGFAVASRASAFMDTNISVSGQMDLGETGTLVLLNNLYFERNITLTSGGNIKGKATVSGDAKTIFLGGDMIIATDSYRRILRITGDWSNSGTSGDLIVDGRGHTLDIQDRAQIFVDINVTLTLRNMTIRTGPKSLMTPPIRLAAHGSKLTLDNVLFDLGADFQFKQGQIFVHDEVAVTGTSAFVYQSPMPSYITSGATWSFECGTTFSVAPSTFTDCPYATNSTYTSNKFIVLADSSSALYLNSCTFKTTYTGLRLTKGMLLLDNRVAVDTVAGVDLNATTPLGTEISKATGINGDRPSVSWSPDAKFLAVTNNTANALQVYRFDGTNSPVAVGATVTTVGASPIMNAWSPCGRFIALVTISGNTLEVYRFTGSTQPVLVGSVSTGAASGARAVAWSPDGKFISVGLATTNKLQVYRFAGVGAPLLVSGTVPTTGSYPISVPWSPDGRFIAVTTNTGNTLETYRFNGIRQPEKVSAITAGGLASCANWSADGRFLAVVNETGNTLQVYRFIDYKSPRAAVGTTAATGANPFSVSWSPDARFLAVVSYGGNDLRVYKFFGDAAPSQLTLVGSLGAQYSVAWSFDGKFIATIGSTGSGNPATLRIYPCNFVSTPATQQTFTNGLVFGQSALGSSYNANVRVLAGAGVALQGKVMDDSA